MHPILLGPRRLQGSSARRRPTAWTAAFAALIVAVAGLAALGGEFTSSAPTSAEGAGTDSGAVVGAGAAGTLEGIDVPAPSADAGLTPLAARAAGRSVYRADAMDLAATQAVFADYLQQMIARDWQLVSKADPDEDGWSQLWRSGDDLVLITLTLRPAVRLAIEACPPRPYC